MRLSGLKTITESTKQKLTDENGDPIVVYHGTDKDFQRFDRELSADGNIWFTSDLDKIVSGESGAAGRSRIIKAHLYMENPAGWDEYDRYFIDQLISQGYDGLILDDDYVVFDESQIEILGVV